MDNAYGLNAVIFNVDVASSKRYRNATANFVPGAVLGASLVQVIICFNCSFDMPTGLCTS